MEAAIGVEPMNRGFADLRLSHLATPPLNFSAVRAGREVRLYEKAGDRVNRIDDCTKGCGEAVFPAETTGWVFKVGPPASPRVSH